LPGQEEGEMRIAILGWGSLVWDPRDLLLSEIFKPGGPSLPLEFSRKSADGRLTLVIDEDHGTPSVPTYYAISAYQALEDAICDLRHREGTTEQNIGVHTIAAGKWERSAKSALAQRAIEEWLLARRNIVDAVIWTNLGPSENFSFSEAAAEKYLKSLTGVCRKKALDYLTKAPPEVKTPLREKMTAWLTKP
jgi:hypothetical protein